ncbi:MAG: hypothetical protein R3D58_16055 [Saprospiraceae bacterium]
MKRHHAFRFQLAACAAAFRTFAGWALAVLAVLVCPPPNSHGTN